MVLVFLLLAPHLLDVDIQTVLFEIFKPSLFETVSYKVIVQHFFEVDHSINLADDNLRIEFRVDQQKIDLSLDGCHFELDDLSSLDGDTLGQKLNLFGTDLSVGEGETEGETCKDGLIPVVDLPMC